MKEYINDETQEYQPIEENIHQDITNDKKSMINETKQVMNENYVGQVNEVDPEVPAFNKMENRSEKEFRMKNNESSYDGAFNRLGAYVDFFKHKITRPSEKTAKKRNNNSHYGYLTNICTTLLSAFIVTRLIESAIERYNFFADLSVFPIFTGTPNYLFLFIKMVVFFASFYFGMAIINFFIKKVILKRQHVLKYWMTQYVGMNTIGLLVLVFTFILTLIAPVGLFVVNVFLLLFHIMSYVVTFVASFYKTVNETAIDNIYLALMGLTVQLFISMGILFILF